MESIESILKYMKKQPHSHLYPEHLYDPVRKQVSLELLQKEFNKQLHEAETHSIDASAWAEQFDEQTFWNAIEGFMGGTMLKPIVHFLTAENYSWSPRSLPVDQIVLSAKLPQLDKVEGLDDDDLSLGRIQQLLADQPDIATKQRQLAESFSRGEEQDSYRVLVVQKESGLMVMDGNRRCLQALLRGEETIDAWYCQTNNEPPRNFWFPIDDMLRLVRAYSGVKETDPTSRQAFSQVLQSIFSLSDVAKTAYTTRVVPYTTGAEELLDK